MKADVDYINDYVQNQAEVKYGCDFDELKDDIKDELWNEAQQDYEETKMDEAETSADSMKDEKLVDDYLSEGYDRMKDEEWTKW